MNLKQARTLCQIGAAFLTLAACSPRIIERVKPVPYAVPVAAPCPLPADVLPRPRKPVAELPRDSSLALAVIMAHLAALDVWADAAEGQIAACSSVKP